MRRPNMCNIGLRRQANPLWPGELGRRNDPERRSLPLSAAVWVRNHRQAAGRKKKAGEAPVAVDTCATTVQNQMKSERTRIE